jgi:hypothetical protein
MNGLRIGSKARGECGLVSRLERFSDKLLRHLILFLENHPSAPEWERKRGERSGKEGSLGFILFFTLFYVCYC